MSVDERLRAAFQQKDVEFIDVEQALVATARRAGRQSLRGVAVVAGLAAAALAVAAVVTLGERSDVDPVTPSPTVNVGPLEGRWRTDPITRADVHRALTAAGAGHYTDALMDGLPPTPWTLTLQVDAEGDWTLRLNRARRTIPLDGEQVQVDGTSLVITPDEYPHGNISSSYAFVVDGPTGSRELTLSLLSTSEVATEQIPGWVYHRAFYMTSSFDELP